MQYINIRVRKDTQHKRKVLSALLDESMLDTVDRLITAEVFYRLDNAMKAFFRRLEAGERPGFPRVRPRHCFFTLCYPAMYLKIKGNTLILPTGGRGKNKKYPNVEAQLAELPPEGFGEVAIRRDGRSNYYASFSYRAEPARPQQGQVVAFDLGVKTLATSVNEQGRVYTIGGFKGARWYNKQRDSLHKASHLMSHKLVERAVVVGDLSCCKCCILTT
jgi:putative transposase